MLESLLWCHGLKGFGGSVAERAAGGSEEELTDLMITAGAEALVGAVVFGVDGEEAVGAMLTGSLHDETTGGDKDFLIGQAHDLSPFHSLVGSLEPGDADNGGHDDVDFRGGGYFYPGCRTE